MTITTKLDDRLAYQFIDSTKFRDFLSAFLQEFENLNISGLQLLNERYLDTSVGVQLDGIGEIVGLARPFKDTADLGLFGFSADTLAVGFGTLDDPEIGGNFYSLGSDKQLIGDDLYRLLIRAQIIQNQSNMTVNETTKLLSFMFGDVVVEYSLSTILEPEYHINKVLTVTEANLLDDIPLLLGIGTVTYTST